MRTFLFGWLFCSQTIKKKRERRKFRSRPNQTGRVCGFASSFFSCVQLLTLEFDVIHPEKKQAPFLRPILSSLPLHMPNTLFIIHYSACVHMRNLLDYSTARPSKLCSFALSLHLFLVNFSLYRQFRMLRANTERKLLMNLQKKCLHSIDNIEMFGINSCMCVSVCDIHRHRLQTIHFEDVI